MTALAEAGSTGEPGRFDEQSERLLASAERAADEIGERAEDMDRDFAEPFDEVRSLDRAGLLLAPFPRAFGGAAIARGDNACRTLLPILRRLGRRSLSLARLYEGHANAIGLVAAYGARAQIERMAEEAREGALFGVWAADDAEGLQISDEPQRRSLRGRKIYCSGAGVVVRALVTARDADGRVWMLTPAQNQGERVDLSGWRVQGMRASATGTVDFTGVSVDSKDIVGGPGDYHRQPLFSGGAWRFAAAQTGGMEGLLHLLAEHLRATGRGGDPHQLARFGEVSIAVETARLWVERAANLAETSDESAEAIVSYVNLARCAVERAALDLLERVQRSVGLTAFVRPHPIDRMARDLATYLRQPGPDRALTEGAASALRQCGDSAKALP